jgi:hypothetical protein
MNSQILNMKTLFLMVVLSFLFFASNIFALNSTTLCISNNTMQTVTNININTSSSNNTISTTYPVFCNTGCSTLTNSCRFDLSIQIFEIIGITIGFFAFLILSIFLSEYIGFLSVIVSMIIAVFSSVLGLTDLFTSPFGYIFYGEAIVFIVSAFILGWRELYG